MTLSEDMSNYSLDVTPDDTDLLVTVYGAAGEIYHFNATDGTLMYANMYSGFYTGSDFDMIIDSDGIYAYVTGKISSVNGY